MFPPTHNAIQYFIPVILALDFQSLIETVFLTFYNVTMAGALPVFVVGLYERPLRDVDLMSRPECYK